MVAIAQDFELGEIPCLERRVGKIVLGETQWNEIVQRGRAHNAGNSRPRTRYHRGRTEVFEDMRNVQNVRLQRHPVTPDQRFADESVVLRIQRSLVGEHGIETEADVLSTDRALQRSADGSDRVRIRSV